MPEPKPKTAADAFAAATNDQSILSKASSVKLGYWDDPLLLAMVPKVKKHRRAPVIHIGYWMRQKAVMKVYESFLASLPDGQSFNVINLGCGYDTFTMRALDQELKVGRESIGNFVDVDFDHVIESKRALMQHSEILKPILQEPNFHLVSADLAAVSDLDTILSSLENHELPTFILSEVVMPYMDNECSTALLRWLSKSLPRAFLCCFEPVVIQDTSYLANEWDAFGGAMLRHYRDSVKSPLHTTECYPTLRSHLRRMADNGFSQALVALGNDVLDHWVPHHETIRNYQREPFDEWEPWIAYVRHCMVLVACNSSTCSSFEFLHQQLDPCGIFHSHRELEISENQSNGETCSPDQCESSVVDTHDRPAFVGSLATEHKHSLSVARYGCCGAVSQDRKLFFVVGGEEENGKRYSGVRIARLDCMQSVDDDHQPGCGDIDLTHGNHVMHATAVAMKVPNCILIFGGRSSPTKASNTVTMLSADNDIISAERVLFTGECGTDPAPCRRYRHSANQIEYNGLERMVVFGGRSEHGCPLDDVWMFDPIEANWESMQFESGTGPCARHSHATDIYDGMIMIYGGMDKDFNVLSDVWMFDPRCCKWRQCKNSLPGLFGHKLMTIQQNVVSNVPMWIVLGGVDAAGMTSALPKIICSSSHTTNDAGLYFLKSSRQDHLGAEDHWKHRFGFNYAVAHSTSSSHGRTETEIYISGGGGSMFSFGHHLNNTAIKLKLRLRSGESLVQSENEMEVSTVLGGDHSENVILFEYS